MNAQNDEHDGQELPFFSNIKEVYAKHYLIQLLPDFKDYVIHGKLLIFLEATKFCKNITSPCPGIHCQCSNDKISDMPNKILNEIYLESYNLKIKSVSQLVCDTQEIQDYVSTSNIKNNSSNFKKWSNKGHIPLVFDSRLFKITIFGKFNLNKFPIVLSIDYASPSNGRSLYWRKDQGKHLCCFTPGSAINNRSLFPHQDRPQAMATWESWIFVPDDYYACMTGDDQPEVLKVNSMPPEYYQSFLETLSCKNFKNMKNIECYYYSTRMLMPLATIAIAIGKWKIKSIVEPTFESSEKRPKSCKEPICRHSKYPCHVTFDNNGPLLATTVVGPCRVLQNAEKLLNFVKPCLRACYEIFGKHPVGRLQLVILPRSFANLGLTSPNLIFISQTLLHADASAYIKLCHEISHFWFGVTIGAKDWHEEWTSEGFATYLEEPIYTSAVQHYNTTMLEECSNAQPLEQNELRNLFELRSYIYYLTLKQEVENSPEDLLILSPNLDFQQNLSECTSVLNGLREEKSFMQVHYLKGFFLLQRLSNLVSKKNFYTFLGDFATSSHGMLISSHDFFEAFFKYFPNVENSITMSELNTWIKSASIELISEIYSQYEKENESNLLIVCVQEHYKYWTSKMTDENLSDEQEKELVKFLFPDQLVLLLEKLLDFNLSYSLLRRISVFYDIPSKNADVRHRWCELIIKNDYPDLKFVEKFLTEDQSMGIYLYGELTISGLESHQKLAHKIFKVLKKELDERSLEVIASMIGVT